MSRAPQSRTTRPRRPGAASRRKALARCVAHFADEASRHVAFRPAAARQAAETWLTVHAFGIAAGRAEEAVFAEARARGRAEGLREAFRAVVNAHHPQVASEAAEAVMFSRDEELLRRCIREAPRLSALELASLLVSDIDPPQLEAEALSAFRRAARRL